MTPTVKPADVLAGLHVAKNLRQHDRDELDAFSGNTPIQGVLLSMHYSDKCYAGYLGEEPAAIFGVGPYPFDPTVGVPWLVGTDRMTEVKHSFLRQSKGWVEELGVGYERLMNFSYIENKLHHQWLLWLGFEAIQVMPYGHQNKPFIQFIKGTSNVR